LLGLAFFQATGLVILALPDLRCSANHTNEGMDGGGCIAGGAGWRRSGGTGAGAQRRGYTGNANDGWGGVDA
jgi:hypothetical protein